MRVMASNMNEVYDVYRRLKIMLLEPPEMSGISSVAVYGRASKESVYACSYHASWRRFASLKLISNVERERSRCPRSVAKMPENMCENVWSSSMKCLPSYIIRKWSIKATTEIENESKPQPSISTLFWPLSGKLPTPTWKSHHQKRVIFYWDFSDASPSAFPFCHDKIFQIWLNQKHSQSKPGRW